MQVQVELAAVDVEFVAAEEGWIYGTAAKINNYGLAQGWSTISLPPTVKKAKERIIRLKPIEDTRKFLLSCFYSADKPMEALLSVIRQYGVFSEHVTEEHRYELPKTVLSFLRKATRSNEVAFIVHSRPIIRSIEKARDTLRVIGAMKDPNMALLEQQFPKHSETKQELLFAGEAHILQYLSEGISKVRLNVRPTVGSGLGLVAEAIDFHSALHLAIAGELRDPSVAFCRKCTAAFALTRPDRRYCSEACSQRARQLEYYHRSKSADMVRAHRKRAVVN